MPLCLLVAPVRADLVVDVGAKGIEVRDTRAHESVDTSSGAVDVAATKSACDHILHPSFYIERQSDLRANRASEARVRSSGGDAVLEGSAQVDFCVMSAIAA